MVKSQQTTTVKKKKRIDSTVERNWPTDIPVIAIVILFVFVEINLSSIEE